MVGELVVEVGGGGGRVSFAEGGDTVVFGNDN